MMQTLEASRETALQAEWETIYRATFPELVLYLDRMLRDRALAEDVAQEAFLKALDHAPANPRPFVFTIARNLARDVLRARSRQQRSLAPIREDEVAVPDSDEQIEHEQLRQRARQALESLSGRDRHMLTLWNAGLTYAEISERTGLALGAIGTTLARARRRLVQAYHSLEEGHGTSW